jgi:hypothetical protein
MAIHIGRREFIVTLGGAVVARPLTARAQQEDGKIARLGWLAASLDNPVQALGREVLTSSLRRLGFSEGHNLVIEHRPTDEGIPKALRSKCLNAIRGEMRKGGRL